MGVAIHSAHANFTSMSVTYILYYFLNNLDYPCQSNLKVGVDLYISRRTLFVMDASEIMWT